MEKVIHSNEEIYRKQISVKSGDKHSQVHGNLQLHVYTIYNNLNQNALVFHQVLIIVDEQPPPPPFHFLLQCIRIKESAWFIKRGKKRQCSDQVRVADEVPASFINTHSKWHMASLGFGGIWTENFLTLTSSSLQTPQLVHRCLDYLTDATLQ